MYFIQHDEFLSTIPVGADGCDIYFQQKSTMLYLLSRVLKEIIKLDADGPRTNKFKSHASTTILCSEAAAGVWVVNELAL